MLPSDGGAALAASSGAVLSPEELLFRVALLAGEGRDARLLAGRLAACISSAEPRSCLEAGAPLQLTVDAPGPRGLRVLLATGPARPAVEVSSTSGAGSGVTHPSQFLLEPDDRDAAALRAFSGLPTWVAWSRAGSELWIDLRGAARTQVEAWVRESGARAWETPLAHWGSPWALRLRSDGRGAGRLHLHWLLTRQAPVAQVLDAVGVGAGADAVFALLDPLLGRVRGVARWVVAQPLDDHTAPGLRVGCARWSLVPEDERKHAAIAAAVAALGGPVPYAEALWSMLRGLAGPGWKVGRGLQVRIVDGQPHLRLILVPQVASAAGPR